MQDFNFGTQIKEIHLGFSNGVHHDVSIIDTNRIVIVINTASYWLPLQHPAHSR